MHNRMMQPGARLILGRVFSGSGVHARQPIASGLFGVGRVCHVDCDKDVICKPVQQNRGIGPTPANVPQAMYATTFDAHEPDLFRFCWIGNIIDRHAGSPIAIGRGLVCGANLFA